MLEPLDVLYEPGDLPAFPLPRELAALYGGTLGFQERRLFSNFVSTIDGVVSIPSLPGSVQMLGGENTADRFLMALVLLFEVGDRVFVQAAPEPCNGFPHGAGMRGNQERAEVDLIRRQVELLPHPGPYLGI